jgi:peptidylprolyl isomerase
MIPGFDQAVRGMAVGDLKSVRIAAGDAYGERDDALLIEVGIDQVPEGAQVGDQLSTSDGQTVVVAEIDGDAVLIDANHPLAGQALTFEIELLSIG